MINDGLNQGWPTQLHYWANIFVPTFKRATKLLMTNLQYFTFTSFSSNFFDDLFSEPHFFPLYLAKAYPQIFFVLSTKFTSSKNFSYLKKFFALIKEVKFGNSKKDHTSLSSGPLVGHPCLCVGHPWSK